MVDFVLAGGQDLESGIAQKHFADLIDIVIHQQLAGSAAVAISARVKLALQNELTPEKLLSADPADLRGSGLSGAKVAAITSLARAVLDGDLVLESLDELDDDDVVAEISRIRGFGPWSAQMFLMFCLRRTDVWPVGDLGVRKGYMRCFQLEELPAPRDMPLLGERFRPYRSIVAWYMWRSLSGPPA